MRYGVFAWTIAPCGLLTFMLSTLALSNAMHSLNDAGTAVEATFLYATASGPCIGAAYVKFPYVGKRRTELPVIMNVSKTNPKLLKSDDAKAVAPIL